MTLRPDAELAVALFPSASQDGARALAVAAGLSIDEPPPLPRVKVLTIPVAAMKIITTSTGGDQFRVKADGTLGWWGHAGDTVEVALTSDAADPSAELTVFYRNARTVDAKRTITTPNQTVVRSYSPNALVDAWDNPTTPASPAVVPIPQGKFTLRIEATASGDWMDLGQLELRSTSTVTPDLSPTPPVPIPPSPNPNPSPGPAGSWASQCNMAGEYQAFLAQHPRTGRTVLVADMPALVAAIQASRTQPGWTIQLDRGSWLHPFDASNTDTLSIVIADLANPTVMNAPGAAGDGIGTSAAKDLAMFGLICRSNSPKVAGPYPHDQVPSSVVDENASAVNGGGFDRVSVWCFDISDWPGSGIATGGGGSTRLWARSNRISGCARWSPYNMSGLNTFGPVSSDGATLGGWGIIVEGNFLVGNECYRTFLLAPQFGITDGNNQIHDYHAGQDNGYTYPLRFLDNSNVATGAGGAGLQTFHSDHGDRAHNTAFGNARIVSDYDQISSGQANDVVDWANLQGPLPAGFDPLALDLDQWRKLASTKPRIAADARLTGVHAIQCGGWPRPAGSWSQGALEPTR